jgi:hypothetical protein
VNAVLLSLLEESKPVKTDTRYRIRYTSQGKRCPSFFRTEGKQKQVNNLEGVGGCLTTGKYA